MGKSTKKSASKAGAAPTKPSNKGKRGAEDIIRNRKKRKKALVEEKEGGAKTRKTFTKVKDDDCVDEQKLKEDLCVLNVDQVNLSTELNPIDSNPRLGDENGGVKKDASAPKEIPATDNGHIDESQNDHPKEESGDGDPKTKDFKVAPSGTLNPVEMEFNSKASKEDRGGEEENFGEEPSKMKEVEESVTVPQEDNSSEEISSEEDIAASSDDAETEMDVTPKEQTAGSKKLFVGNLSYSVEQAEVEDFFKATGEIVGVHLAMRSDSSFRGFAHVEFTTAEGAIKALNELNGQVLAGRPVRLELAKEKETKVDVAPEEQPAGSKTLFVGNLSFSVEQADVENFFKVAGEIVGVRLAMGSDRSFRGFGHVEFNTAEGAVKALNQLNGKVLVGRPVRLELSKEKEVQSFQNGGRATRQTIFVCGFNKDDGEDQIRSALRDHFGSCGEITRVSIPQDKDGVRGIAYIDFKNYDAYNQALEFNGSVFHENTLTVEVADPRDDGFDSGNRGGRRHGRQGSGGRFGGHQRDDRTRRGCFSGHRRGRFSGHGLRGCGRATPGRS